MTVFDFPEMRSATIELLSNLIELNKERVLAYEHVLRKLKSEEDPDTGIFENLIKGSSPYKQALNDPFAGI